MTQLTDPVRIAGRSRLIWGAAVAAVVASTIVIDQATKAIALASLPGRVIELFPPLSLRLAFNPGVSFGLGAEWGSAAAAIVTTIVVAISVWLIVQIIRRRGNSQLLLIAVVNGGGWGNIIDRIFRSTDAPLSGAVVDMIAVDGFAIFNVADVFVVGGIAALVISQITCSRRGSEALGK